MLLLLTPLPLLLPRLLLLLPPPLLLLPHAFPSCQLLAGTRLLELPIIVDVTVHPLETAARGWGGDRMGVGWGWGWRWGGGGGMWRVGFGVGGWVRGGWGGGNTHSPRAAEAHGVGQVRWDGSTRLSGRPQGCCCCCPAQHPLVGQAVGLLPDVPHRLGLVYRTILGLHPQKECSSGWVLLHTLALLCRQGSRRPPALCRSGAPPAAAPTCGGIGPACTSHLKWWARRTAQRAGCPRRRSSAWGGRWTPRPPGRCELGAASAFRQDPAAAGRPRPPCRCRSSVETLLRLTGNQGILIYASESTIVKIC